MTIYFFSNFQTNQSSKHGYDSDSDLEDLYFFIKDSAKQLKITDQFLKKKVKDFQGTGIDLNSSKYVSKKKGIP